MCRAPSLPAAPRRAPPASLWPSTLSRVLTSAVSDLAGIQAAWLCLLEFPWRLDPSSTSLWLGRSSAGRRPCVHAQATTNAAGRAAPVPGALSSAHDIVASPGLMQPRAHISPWPRARRAQVANCALLEFLTSCPMLGLSSLICHGQHRPGPRLVGALSLAAPPASSCSQVASHWSSSGQRLLLVSFADAAPLGGLAEPSRRFTAPLPLRHRALVSTRTVAPPQASRSKSCLTHRLFDEMPKPVDCRRRRSIRRRVT